MKQIPALLFGIIILTLPTVTQAQESNWRITDFHSDIAIQADGVVKITETIAVDFGTTQKHGIFRDIPYTYQSTSGTYSTDITVTSVTTNNQTVPYETSRNGANVRIKIGDANRTISGRQTYTIAYQAVGVLKSFGNYDELYWNVTGNDWEVLIDQAAATVTLPEAGIVQIACYSGRRGSTERCSQSSKDAANQTAHFVSGVLSPGEGLTIAVGYTNDMVPILQATGSGLTDVPTRSPTQIGLGFVATFLLGIALLLRQWMRIGRDKWWKKNDARAEPIEQTMPFGASHAIAPEFSPPDNLRPAQLGVILDEKADTLDVSATIVDLATRGYLTITEIPKKWLFGSTDYLFTRTRKDDKELLPYERSLLHKLFSGSPEIKMSDLKTTFYDDLAVIKNELYDEATQSGLFIKHPQKVRTLYYAVGGGLIVIGIALAFVSSVLSVPLLLGSAFALALLGPLYLAFAHAMPARTAKGRDLYRRAKGYELFVGSTEKFKSPFLEKEGIFEQILPYAIVFGVTKKLAKAFEAMDIKPASPSWYVGAHPFNSVVFASNIDSFSHSLSSAMASTPSSSGSGGGGFSGGGFGGGGGGSW